MPRWKSTERQFIGLLARRRNGRRSASGCSRCRKSRGGFGAPVPGGLLCRHRRAVNARLDGLIVTGTEPRRDALPDEPYWPVFTRIVDWAARNTVSTVWSCLAAHAAVLHLDGVARHPLADKCFGIFQSERPRPRPDGGNSGAIAGAPFALERPAGGCADGMRLWRAGASGRYRRRHFHQGDRQPVRHAAGPSGYEASTLLREYRRDVGQFLRRERDVYPGQPHRYFDQPSAQALDAFRARALAARSVDLLESFPPTSLRESLISSARASAVRLYRNWLFCISARRDASPRAVPAAMPELVRP